MANLDDLIEEIVYMIFECEVSLDDPTQTIKEIKESLNPMLNLKRKLFCCDEAKDRELMNRILKGGDITSEDTGSNV